MNPSTDFFAPLEVPPALVQAWRRRGIHDWTALQEAAWAEGLHASLDPWLIAAPTSAGKGLLAEVCAAAHLLRGEKVLWLVPTRALAEAAAAQLEQAFAPLGLRVLCATHDHATAELDTRLARHDFDLLVAVYEKAAAWLVRQPHGLAEVGLVVADELTVLRDAERGGRLDLLLTLIQTSPYAPRRLGLCLPGPNLGELSHWWGGRLLACDARPRALHEGVLDCSRAVLRWRDRVSGQEAEESLAPPGQFEGWLAKTREVLEEGDWPPLLAATGAVAAGLAQRDEPTLLFAPSRPLTRRWADALGQAFTLAAPPAALVREAERLARLEPDHDHQLLLACLRRGVAFHHADLSPPARSLVEEAFRARQVALLVATPTLAQGINLSAINVVHWPERALNAGSEGGWRSVPLERWRFMDQGGRAARLGFGDRPGRSLLVAWNARRAGQLWQRYIVEDPEPIASSLALPESLPENLSAGLLLALAGDVARTRENLHALFAATFAGAALWRREPQTLDAELGRALERCERGHLIQTATAGGGYRLSGLGQVCAAQGLSAELAARLAPLLAEGYVPDPAEPLPAVWSLALCAPQGLWPQAARPGRSPLLNQARRWFEEHAQPIPPPLERLFAQPGGARAAQLAALEAGWRLALWIGPEPTAQVEERTGWTAGMLARAGETLAWIAGGAAGSALALGAAAQVAEGWRSLGARLAAGVGSDGVALARLRLAALGRSTIQALAAAGLGALRALAEAPLTLIEQAVGDPKLARTLRECIRRAVSKGRAARIKSPVFETTAADEVSPSVPPEMTPPTPAGPACDSTFAPSTSSTTSPIDNKLLEIDLQSPGLVRLAGRELALTPLTFDLLATLAERPGKVLTRAALYQKLWPEGGPEDQQLDAHRRRLARELRPALGGRPGALIEVVRGVGFRLNLPAHHVQLSRG